MSNEIEEFDLCKLQKAKKLICEVYEYYYGAPRMGQVTRRLETIMNKIDFLLEGKIAMKNTPEPPATIELEDNIPGMVIEPPELPEREIPEDFNI